MVTLKSFILLTSVLIFTLFLAGIVQAGCDETAACSTDTECAPGGVCVGSTAYTEGACRCPDDDGDGVPNLKPDGTQFDLCPNTQSVVDANGCSDADVDGDGDGICNPGAPSAGPSGCTGSDNCPTVANANLICIPEL